MQGISKRITSNKTKHLLIENELKKVQKFDSSCFRGKSHFEKDGTQNYLVFQSMYRHFKRVAGVGNANYIYFWKPKGFSNEKINSNTVSNYSITPKLSEYGTRARVKFSGSCLRQDKATYNHRTIVNIYIVFEISKNYNISSYPALENCLFGAVSLTKHVEIDQYKYSGYDIGFNRKGEFSFGIGFGRNCIILGADTSSSVHANNRTKNILVLGKDFVQGLENTTIYAEKLSSRNFTKTNTKFCLSLHYNVVHSYLLMVQTFINLKQNILRLW